MVTGDFCYVNFNQLAYAWISMEKTKGHCLEIVLPDQSVLLVCHGMPMALHKGEDLFWTRDRAFKCKAMHINAFINGHNLSGFRIRIRAQSFFEGLKSAHDNTCV